MDDLKKKKINFTFVLVDFAIEDMKKRMWYGWVQDSWFENYELKVIHHKCVNIFTSFVCKKSINNKCYDNCLFINDIIIKRR